MLELEGDECPLLFGKWKPEIFTDNEAYEISDLSDEETIRDQTYTFPFALVSIKKEEILPYLISAEAVIPHGKDIFDVLFDPNMSSMYSDAKRYMAEEMRKASAAHPELRDIDLEARSRFSRTNEFEIIVDYEKLEGGIRNVQGRDALCRKVYDSLVGELKKRYSVVSHKPSPRNQEGFSVSNGTLEEFRLAEGTAFFAELPLPNINNAGLSYLSVASDERGKKAFHSEVYNFCIRHINSNFKDNLRLYGGQEAIGGTNGNGASWAMDLSSIKALRWESAGALHWRRREFSEEEKG